MPQMSPLNWISLFLSFSLIFLLINSYNYYFINYSFNKKITKTSSLIKINWKW
uniref:ATP synthase complex subunit 8 n=1 Tax=Trichodes sinae TaxID=1850556 RepID=A0A1L2DZ93_9CUCU|nr:ATP synthase F0 subunit 8 [Trichodes sinae]ANG08440.1 ATP synthase F0 subunit 8 [Trichodes sinae]